jgi:hypothetical protein
MPVEARPAIIRSTRRRCKPRSVSKHYSNVLMCDLTVLSRSQRRVAEAGHDAQMLLGRLHSLNGCSMLYRQRMEPVNGGWRA